MNRAEVAGSLLTIQLESPRVTRATAAHDATVRSFDALRLAHDSFVSLLTTERCVGPSRLAHRVGNKFFVPTANSWYIALGQNSLLL